MQTRASLLNGYVQMMAGGDLLYGLFGKASQVGRRLKQMTQPLPDNAYYNKPRDLNKVPTLDECQGIKSQM